MTEDKPAFPDGAARVPPGAISAEPFNLPPIPLGGPSPQPAAPVPSTPAKKEPEVKDTFRELIETIVFVVVLVLMLKTFLAEAFVIPTGSMANTLLGYHFKVRCEQCGYPNLVNASTEAEAADPKQRPRIIRCQCINCQHMNELRREPAKGGQP